MRTRRRARARMTGVVQGVGFRPFVFRLASELGLGGFVLNDSEGVLLEVEGTAPEVEGFLVRLSEEAPPLAIVEAVRVSDREPRGDRVFRIVASDRTGSPSALVSPDTAICADCLEELFDPGDRRYRYPFINCTSCGPRFTIVQGVPYDRSRTTMAGFEMCGPCRAEYEDPTSRRFHAQPNACPDCGPSVRLLVADGGRTSGAVRLDAAEAARGPGAPDAPIRRAAEALNGGGVVAVKGLGGYHLACRADDQEAVARLRARKHREDKPFALMAPDLEAARELVRLGAEEEALLLHRARPIVLARRLLEAPVAPAAAPGQRDLGVMLPYSPLHHLLLDAVGETLVLTSGNVSDEPITHRDDEAVERLVGIAELFLVHDRPIHMRTDDSVARVVSLPGGRRPLVLRRSRGFVPMPLDLPLEAPPLLACGGHLKNTFCLAKGNRAWVGHHIGDLESYETIRSFREGIEHFEELFEIRPEEVVHDRHPDYLSTKHALEGRSLPATGVQHHHAHLAACLGEHGETGLALGAIYDGTGYGDDGTMWGGELLLGDPASYRRVGHLWPVPLPGGEAAVRQPWRMACSWLCELEEDVPAVPPTLRGRVDPGEWRAVARMALEGFASPTTTSMGRLFDAVSALCGLRTEVTYEGQAAIELEMAAASPDDSLDDPLHDSAADAVSDARADGRIRCGKERIGDGKKRTREDPGPYPLAVIRSDGGLRVLDARETIRAIRDDLDSGEAAAGIAARFHEAVARATTEACRSLAGEHGVSSVVLSGGVFQNVVLLESTAAELVESGLRPLVPEHLPPNDGGLSFGQVVVAAARLRGESTGDL